MQLKNDEKLGQINLRFLSFKVFRGGDIVPKNHFIAQKSKEKTNI
jgi:hypothetical protein